MQTSAKQRPFDLLGFLTQRHTRWTLSKYRERQIVYSQGDPADSVFYIHRGKVKVIVVSERGKEAVVAIRGPDEFCGEGALTGKPFRLASLKTVTPCEIVRLEKATLARLLHQQPKFSDYFIHHLLTRTARVESDLVDQLFNSSEKRLARVLLLLAHFGKEGIPETVVPKISQETLAEMVGTTRSRVSFFMNRFRKLGFIHYAGGTEGALQVHSSLLNVVLHD
jgi:CRP/FNR family cyclic AMP-dependent transcriptional regulator